MRVVAESLSIAVAGRMLYEDVHFDWRGPGVVAVIGPSGSGKSTLLSAVIGWTTPSAGTLCIEPSDASVWLVPQNAPLLDSRTVSENLEVALLATHGVSRGPREAEADRSIDHVLDVFNLTGLAMTKGKHLSGGERQRVALARAALRLPTVLLADEVTAGLDPESVHMVSDALRELAHAGCLVIVATHDERVWSGADEVFDLAEVVR